MSTLVFYSEFDSFEEWSALTCATFARRDDLPRRNSAKP
jgi:hypothetical protein